MKEPRRQSERPIRYYIVKTEEDDRPVVRSVPVTRPLAVPSTEAPSVESGSAMSSEGDAAGRPERSGGGRLARAAAAIRRHPGR